MPVEIEGMEQALQAFRTAPSIARQYIGHAVSVTEITLAGRVRQKAPVQTGALRLAVTSKTTGLRASISIESGDIYGRRPSVYWRFVEFGSIHNIPAKPFIRPSAEEESEPFVNRIREAGKRLERELQVL